MLPRSSMSVRVVSRLWKSFLTNGMCSKRDGRSCFYNTTPAEDRYIVLSIKRNWFSTEVENQFCATACKQMSRKAVARRLHQEGPYTRRPVIHIPLTKNHRSIRLIWCRQHRRGKICLVYYNQMKIGSVSRLIVDDN